MRNIYDELNDINVQYGKVELSDIERYNMKKFAKKYSKKNFKLPKLIGIAAAFIMIFGFLSPNVRAAVGKFTTELRVSLMDTIGASTEAEEYILDMHKEITVGNTSFILEDLTLEDNRIYMNTLSSTDENNSFSDLPSILHVVVNGNKIKAIGTSAKREVVGENHDTVLYTSATHFEKDFPKNGDLDLEICFYDGKDKTNILLETSMEELTKNTINLIDDFKLAKSNNYVINYMKLNPISLTAKVSHPNDDYVLELMGKDSDNRKIQLDLITQSPGESLFIYNSDFSDVTLDEFKDNYSEFEFTLQAWIRNTESGKETMGDAFQIGDSFFIE